MNLTPSAELDQLLQAPEPILALAPMQDVTDLPFMRLMSRYGGADLYYTEYFRVYHDSCLDKHILKSITRNPTSRPVIAQMIGNDIPALVRSAIELQEYPIAAVDLNLGCPAPVVYRKCAGGGLLREPERVDKILEALRAAVRIKFTVKTRIGFEDSRYFDQLLEIFARHRVDLVTVHGRTVAGGYRSAVDYDFIRKAVETLPCPVLANGNIYSAQKAGDVLQATNARGLMIGRAAIRNPWLFDQIRTFRRGESIVPPTGRAVLAYIEALWAETFMPGMIMRQQVQKMKKYINFVGLGVEPTGKFLHDIRRVSAEADFFRICREYLDHDRPMPLEPFAIPFKEGDVMAGENL